MTPEIENIMQDLITVTQREQHAKETQARRAAAEITACINGITQDVQAVPRIKFTRRTPAMALGGS